MEKRFQEPGWFTRNVFNRIVALLTRLGISMAGSRVLEVKGRKSGEWRRTPVNLLVYEGNRYLVAPRGETQWVRNMRVSGGGRLVLGGRSEEFSATEVGEEEKPPLLRAEREWRIDDPIGIKTRHSRVELEVAAGAGRAQGEEEDHPAADGHDPHLAADYGQG